MKGWMSMRALPKLAGRESWLAAIVSPESTFEVGLGHHPIALNCGGRNAQRLGSLLDRKSGKETQFNDARLLRIEPAQIEQRIIERHQIDLPLLHELCGLVQFQLI